LIEAALLDHVGRELGCRNHLRRAELRRARSEIGIEEVGRRRGLDAAPPLHRLVLGEELERYRERAVHELVQKDSQLLARALDGFTGRLRVAPGNFLEPHKLALDLVSEGDDGVETYHLDRARCLV